MATKDIKLPNRKSKKTLKSFRKCPEKIVKWLKNYFKAEAPRGRQSLVIFGLVIAALALMLGLVPDLNSYGLWLAVMALIFGLLSFVMKSGGRTKQLLLLAAVALLVCVASVSIQNDLRQQHVNNLIDRKEGRATQELLEKDVDIEIGKFENGSLPIKLTNNNSATKSYSLLITAKTESGAEIINQNISFGSLDPGETKEYNTFSSVSDAVKSTLGDAKFEVVTVSQY